MTCTMNPAPRNPDQACAPDTTAASCRCRRSGLLLILPLLLLIIAVFVLPARNDEDERLLDLFVDNYFKYWSSRSMEAYEDCFHPDATIYYVDSLGRPRGLNLPTFIALQKDAHLKAPEPMTEVPTSKVLSVNGNLAETRVRWKLTSGSEVTTGIDIFNLVKDNGRWRILTLVFAADGSGQSSEMPRSSSTRSRSSGEK